MSGPGSRITVRQFVLFLAAYLVAVSASEHLYGSLAVPAPFWLPDSVLLCALLLTRPDQWGLIILSTWPIRFATGAVPGTPLWFLVVSIANDSIKAPLTAWLLQRVLGRPVRFDSLRNFLIFLGIAAGAVPLVSALVAAPARHALGDPLWTAGYKWFLGDALAQVIVTPMLLYWCTRTYRGVRIRKRELVLVLGGLAAVLYYAFVAHESGFSPIVLYAPVPLLLWAAIRLRPFGTANALALMSGASMLSAVRGTGIFAVDSANERVLSMQLFLLLVGVSMLSLSILVAERETRTRELETLLDVAPTAILIATDPDCRHIVANRIGSTMRQLADASEERPLRRAVTTGRPVLGELTTVALPDGTERHLLGSATPLRNESGETRGAIGVFLDITDRRLAEKALQESEERFRLVADTAPVLIWMSGTDKGCTFFNKGWLGFTGRSFDEEAGMGWLSGVYPDDLELCQTTYSNAFEARWAFVMEYRLLRFDGAYRWVVDHGVPRFDNAGTFRGYIGSCIDVTDRKLSEVRLQELSGQLLDAQEEERARIARELHDDFGQRIALMQIGLEQFAQGLPALAADSKRQLRSIVEAATAISSEIHSLSHQLHPSTLDILGLEQSMNGFCREFSERHQLPVLFAPRAVPARLEPYVSLCAFRIVQEALRNVLEHSRAAMVTVELTGHGDSLHLSVVDDGAGFDPSAIPAGLGLTSMRERLRPLGGRLTVRSAPSQGTRIDVEIPLVARAGNRLASPGSAGS